MARTLARDQGARTGQPRSMVEQRPRDSPPAQAVDACRPRRRRGNSRGHRLRHRRRARHNRSRRTAADLSGRWTAKCFAGPGPGAGRADANATPRLRSTSSGIILPSTPIHGPAPASSGSSSRRDGLRLWPPCITKVTGPSPCRARCAASAITASRPTPSAFDPCGSMPQRRRQTNSANLLLVFTSRSGERAKRVTTFVHCIRRIPATPKMQPTTFLNLMKRATPIAKDAA